MDMSGLYSWDDNIIGLDYDQMLKTQIYSDNLYCTEY